MEKLHSLPKHILESEEAREVQAEYDRLVVDMNQYEKATVEVSASHRQSCNNLPILHICFGRENVMRTLLPTFADKAVSCRCPLQFY